jgi:hypothetical protein
MSKLDPVFLIWNEGEYEKDYVNDLIRTHPDNKTNP